MPRRTLLLTAKEGEKEEQLNTPKTLQNKKKQKKGVGKNNKKEEEDRYFISRKLLSL
jgi:hypothetical protein